MDSLEARQRMWDDMLAERATDFIIKCGDMEIAVHKIVVSVQSPVLHAACFGPFLEARTGVYEFLEEVPNNIRRLIKWLYLRRYTNHTGLTLAEDPRSASWLAEDNKAGLTDLKIHARMFSLGEYLQIEALKDYASTRFKEDLAVQAGIAVILEAVPEVYNFTPATLRVLRDCVVITFRWRLANHSTRLEENYQMPKEKRTHADATTCVDDGGIYEFMKRYDELSQGCPEFVKDVISSYARVPVLTQCTQCQTCQPAIINAMTCQECKKKERTW